ncbi:hypothetical protein GQ55_9G619900 [Panicum hallii var. hallii]|uniref:PIG-P domain-containing protein n=1 Tax=Panicum hallii var. hallii TaxID=1504633 RepID=A0A2T7CI44_9POAL|nr:hypothetical protein GQ55_9G619900 [Panicum hallii var. hallii]
MDDAVRKTREWSPPPPSLVVHSPRQTVSRLRRRRPHRDWDPSSGSPSFAARDHGPKPSEVYGFVGSITTVMATAVYLAWAYTPEPCLLAYICRLVWLLCFLSFRYWELAVPSFVIVAVSLSMVIHMGLNFLATPTPTSFSAIFDENSRERIVFSPAMEEERPIEPISDISVVQTNNLMFGDT